MLLQNRLKGRPPSSTRRSGRPAECRPAQATACWRTLPRSTRPWRKGGSRWRAWALARSCHLRAAQTSCRRLLQAARWADEGVPEDVHAPRFPGAKHLEVCVRDVRSAVVPHFTTMTLMCMQGLASISFGAVARRELFVLDPAVHFLNHGSYGAALRWACGAMLLARAGQGH